ncbi:fructosamine kinase family protein [Kribbella pittospori]|uniref:fructosamine kinase family protein n=1 Tax=Kribbella pittospori TaxID=722689 RepID=UPI0013F3BFF3|nr:fructosamine kinase family protein [Kribbella pittospori]
MLNPAWLDGLSLGDAVSASPVDGGYASKTYRVSTTLGRSAIVKTHDDVPVDLYALEADGLEALGVPGAFVVPEVLRVTPTFIVLSDLGSSSLPSDSDDFWRDAGRRLAVQHQQTADKFGYHLDNYLGVLPQRNPWTDDGHAFFAEHRLLRYLEVPNCYNALSPDDRHRLERLANRLPDLIPPQPASLLHGDLWHGNLLPAPALIDPAVHYGWPEAELATLITYGHLDDDAFLGAYQDLHPLAPDWRSRIPLLHLREQLCVLAHAHALSSPNTLTEIHTTLQPF